MTWFPASVGEGVLLPRLGERSRCWLNGLEDRERKKEDDCLKADDESTEVDINADLDTESIARPTLEERDVGLDVPGRRDGVDVVVGASRSSVEPIFSNMARAVLNRAW